MRRGVVLNTPRICLGSGYAGLGKNSLQLLGTNRNVTVIDAAGSNRRVLTLSNAANTRIEGVCLRGGTLTGSGNFYGGGVYMENCAGVTFASCTFLTNRVQSSDNGAGAGVYAIGSVTAYRTVFCSNEADNVTYRYGQGGGVYASGPLFLRNCLFYTNRAASQGDAVYIAGGSAVLESCTVARHGRDGLYRAAGTVAATNCVVWGNGDDLVGSIALAYCDIEDGDSNTVNGCINGDPKFEDTTNGNFRLGRGSAVINQGFRLPWMTGGTDLDGNTRIRAGSVDMGAYEALDTPGSLMQIM